MTKNFQRSHLYEEHLSALALEQEARVQRARYIAGQVSRLFSAVPALALRMLRRAQLVARLNAMEDRILEDIGVTRETIKSHIVAAETRKGSNNDNATALRKAG